MLVQENAHVITDVQQSVFKRYRITYLRVVTYKMAAKINWHRYGTKLRHCHLMYSGSVLAASPFYGHFMTLLLLLFLLRPQ